MNPNCIPHLGLELRKLRTVAELSVAQVSTRAKVSVATIQLLERGDIRHAGLRQLSTIGRVMGRLPRIVFKSIKP